MSLPRHTELRRFTPMPGPTAPIARSAPIRRSEPRPRTKRRTGKAIPAADIPTSLRALVLARDLERCVRCGRHTAGRWRSIQHRIPRGMGGTAPAIAHTSANLVLACGSATTDCHGWMESYPNEARDQGGWRVPRGHDPAAHPVLVHWLGWCWPGDEWIPLQDGEHGLCQA